MVGVHQPPFAQLRQGLIIYLCALIAGIGLCAEGASAADCLEPLTKLSACAKTVEGDVVVGSNGCKSVYVDQTGLTFRRIMIDTGGELCVRDADVKGDKDNFIALFVEKISIKGALQVGSEKSPIGSSNGGNEFVITFSGNAPTTVDDTQAMDCLDPKFQKGLELCSGGILRLFGAKGVPVAGSARSDNSGKVSWTYLSQPAGDPCRFGPNSGAGSPVQIEQCNNAQPGGKTLVLADAVDWQIGDWIVIATTSFSPFETEFAQIVKISPDRKTLTLEKPLVYYHFGSADPGLPSEANFKAGRETNWGVDERAEVGLITRNVRLASRWDGTMSSQWGGETIFRKDFKEASVQGVEFSLLGKPKLGSYPVHFHMDGTIGPQQKVLMNANSIHHSFNKCITVHSTQKLVIENNVCARAVGHLFYQEVGDEDDITFRLCFSIEAGPPPGVRVWC